MSSGTTDRPPPPTPSSLEPDVFGLTDRGHVRAVNADHFLVASLHRALRVHASSLDDALGPLETDSRGFLFLVADGVGGLSRADAGSLQAIRTVAQYLLQMSELFARVRPSEEEALLERLRGSVLRGHEALLDLAAEAAEMAATTLTMVTVVWPRAFLVHAGDSRCYRLRGGELQRMTTDQTMAQAMRGAGVLTAEAAAASHLKHALWSALGSPDVEPEAYATDCERSDVLLLCTDGLTKHVAEEEIAACLRGMASAEAACRELVALALARGGEDNVTVVIGRVRP